MIEQISELCKEKFKGELDSVLTLANVVCWVLFLISWYVFYHIGKLTLLWGLSSVKVKTIFDFANGVFSSFSALEILISLLFVVSVSWVSRELSEGLFYLFTLREDFSGHMAECNITLLKLKKSSPLAMHFLGKEAEVKLSEGRLTYSRRRTLSQIALGFGFSALIGLNMNFLNILIFLCAFVFFVMYSWAGFHFYVEKILPYYIAKEFTLGRLADFEKGVD